MKNLLLVVLGWVVATVATAQLLPIEVMSGHKRTGADVLWFKKFSSQKNDPWLFFHRSRGSSDYHNSTSFAVTNALSYNFKSGLGIVAATQFLLKGFTVKFGVQYFRGFKNGSIFSWLVSGNNTAHHFSADWFVLSRWTPRLNAKWKWFLQGESLSSLDNKSIWGLTQRIRVGLGLNQWQFGAAADFSESGKTNLSVTSNIGGFIRKEF